MKRSRKIFSAVEPYIWLTPSVALMTVFVLFPIFIVFKTSFTKISKTGLMKGFTGFDNFRNILAAKEFPVVLTNTLVWTVAVVVLSTLIGFVLAMVLNTNFKGRKIVRSIVVFPWATSLIIQASIWKYIINYDYGILNAVLLNLGIIPQRVNFTSSYQAFFAWECACGIFVTVPFVTFCVLAGLQSISASYYEAADIDGAGFWQKLRYVTVPLVKPSLTVSTVLNIIYVFNSFPIVWTITKGDPANRTDTLVTWLYKLNFTTNDKGGAAAVSVIGFLILCVCAGIYMVFSMKNEEE